LPTRSGRARCRSLHRAGHGAGSAVRLDRLRRSTGPRAGTIPTVGAISRRSLGPAETAEGAVQERDGERHNGSGVGARADSSRQWVVSTSRHAPTAIRPVRVAPRRGSQPLSVRTRRRRHDHDGTRAVIGTLVGPRPEREGDKGTPAARAHHERICVLGQVAQRLRRIPLEDTRPEARHLERSWHNLRHRLQKTSQSVPPGRARPAPA
jgi:hypothetical protein